MSRRGEIDAAGRALWDAVSRTVRPLKGRPEVPAPPFRASRPAPPASVAGGKLPDEPARRPSASPRAFDSRLDLHGMSEAEAHRRLLSHLTAARARGERCALVITGKGRRAETAAMGTRASPTPGRGALRRLVPLWLETATFARLVRACRPAHPRDGGEGALYVLLRRARR